MGRDGLPPGSGRDVRSALVGVRHPRYGTSAPRWANWRQEAGMAERARRFDVRGRVQGVGFREHVRRAADA
ncbi:MAG: acylphosphatase, partial [Planctomycetes bacterium]|nr:acylphosphatase [Planctomycetota bacterium]